MVAARLRTDAMREQLVCEYLTPRSHGESTHLFDSPHRSNQYFDENWATDYHVPPPRPLKLYLFLPPLFPLHPPSVE